MDLKLIAENFFGAVDIGKITPIESGLINHTYLVETDEGKYILQKINTSVFENPAGIQNNHLKINRLLEKGNYSRKTVPIIPTLKGDLLFEKENEVWRMLNYLDHTVTFLKAPNKEVVFEAAKCFSEFYKNVNVEEIKLEETLPDFINFEKRIADFKIASKINSKRKITAEKEIDFIFESLSLPEQWMDFERKNILPKRVIHADPKLSNLLFNKENNAVAVIDLDTIMHGTILYDFGDMIRSYTNTSEEDDGVEVNNFSAENYIAVRDGFLFYLKDALSKLELEHLEYAAKTVIFIQAVRFLTDYLNDDRYYSTKYEYHNLDRAKNQINLLKGLQLFLN